MDEKIIEKPLFFLGFFDTSRKSLKACGDALGEPLGTPWGALGDARGSLGDAWGGLGDARGGLGDALGGLGDALGHPWGAHLEELQAFRGVTSVKDLPGSPTRRGQRGHPEAP